MPNQIVQTDEFAKATCLCRHAPWRKSSGFTLLELLVALAVMLVVLTVAVPAMTATMGSIRLSSLSSTFVSHLHLARSEAIKRNGRVVLCKSPTGESCVGSGGWEQGWIVFHDINNNAMLEPGETVIQREGAMSAGFRLVGNLNVAKYVSYSATGSAKLVTGAFQAGTLTLCQPLAPDGAVRHIVISSTGRPRIHKDNLTACL